MFTPLWSHSEAMDLLFFSPFWNTYYACQLLGISTISFNIIWVITCFEFEVNVERMYNLVALVMESNMLGNLDSSYRTLYDLNILNNIYFCMLLSCADYWSLEYIEKANFVWYALFSLYLFILTELGQKWLWNVIRNFSKWGLLHFVVSRH